MKRFLLLSLFLSLFFARTTLAQKNTISGAVIIHNTDVIKTKKEISRNLFLMGEAGLMVGDIGFGHDIMLTVGYRFKERFVAGGGIGYFGCYADNYPGFLIYGYGRADILKNRKIAPYASLYLGGNIPFGVYISPMIGVRIPISKSIKFNISTGYVAASVLEYDGEEMYVSSNWSLRIGVEF